MFDSQNSNKNNSVLTVTSPPDSGFSPRREFVPDNHVPSSFALLSIAGSSLVRLSSFPGTLKFELKRVLEARANVRAVREDPAQNLVEFNVEGKPWAASKSIHSELLFLDVLSVIFLHGFRYVSTIDYGREYDDKLCIAFAKPETSPDAQAQRPAVFAISFPSSTTLRVINAPLSTTPAILQGVRSAWPRGVVSEKTVSDRCYEFKLKGYKWFQEDTFATDSLQQIMRILQTLDRHAFSLLSSISLSGNRSRVKDLWIFTGAAQVSPSDSAYSSGSELFRMWSGKQQADSPPSEQLQQHHRTSSLPENLLQARHNNSSSHARSASTSDAQNRTPSVLRKKNSRILAATPPQRLSSEDSEQRRMSSSSAGDTVDMTGVGTLRQRMTAHQMMMIDVDPMQGSSRYMDGRYPDPNYENQLRADATSGRIQTGQLFYITPPQDKSEDDEPALSPDNSDGSPSASSQGSSQRFSFTPQDSAEGHEIVSQGMDHRASDSVRDSSPQILSPDAFRDSKFSSSTGYSCEIPIAWTGGHAENWKDTNGDAPFVQAFPSPPDHTREQITERPRRIPFARHSSPLGFPGAWQPTPIDEGPEEQMGLHETSFDNEVTENADHTQMPERKEVDAARVASPTLSESPAATRKSEVALYDMAPRRRVSTDKSQDQPTSSPARPTSIASGWVLVNVERPQRDSRSFTSQPRSPVESDATGSQRSLGVHHRSTSTLTQQEYSMSPVAKVIAAADAVSNVPVEPVTQPNASGGLLKIFSGKTKVKSRRLTPEGRVVKVKELEREELERKERSKSRKMNIRDRLRGRSQDSNDY